MNLEMIRRTVTSGEVVDLSQPLGWDTPHHPNHPPYMFRLAKKHGDVAYAGGATTSNDLMVMTTHVGTHIDGLGHVGCCGELHGGVSAKDAGDTIRGYPAPLGIDHTDPIIRRGVLVDVARHVGTDCLPPAFAITADILAAACAAQEIEIREGDTVLIRTGWQKHWTDIRAYVAIPDGSPGPDHSAAVWLGDKGIAVSGSDTLVYEKSPDPSLPVHVEFLVRRGILIMECMALDALAQHRPREFLFIALPLRIEGGTGSPIRPVAIL